MNKQEIHDCLLGCDALQVPTFWSNLLPLLINPEADPSFFKIHSVTSPEDNLREKHDSAQSYTSFLFKGAIFLE
jgi:hypothetical protein